VNVGNEVGQMQNIRVRPFEIAPGCALMYYPEANALVSTSVDPRSKTPAFKSAVARVVASNVVAGPKVEVTIGGGKERREKAALKAC
jgi:hypothetical protein